MVTVEARVDADKLRELLAEAHESDRVEYISACNLDQRRDVVELASEIGALAARGGYLVLGADSHGRPTSTLDARLAAQFDDATVRDKLGRYLPDLDLHVGQHADTDRLMVVIAVMPHPDGAVVFARDGAYEHNGKQTVAFRKGEIFVRHGSKSERPTQNDIAQLRTDGVERGRLWVQHLATIGELVVELGRIVDREADTHTDARLFKLGVPTQLHSGREQLKLALALLARAGGPNLPTTHKLAHEAHFVFANQVRAEVSGAISEFAFTAQTRTT